jgi:hypothetical protein
MFDPLYNVPRRFFFHELPVGSIEGSARHHETEKNYRTKIRSS